MWKNHKSRCHWANPKNPLYIAYHDTEWGRPVHEDGKLFEMLLLESFQAGLSWETILNRRENFRKAFDGFNPVKISQYGEDDISRLKQEAGIIRNGNKIKAVIGNAQVFLDIQKEWGSFSAYLWHFTGNTTLHEIGKASSPLSDTISKDLKKRGMKYVGTTIIYAYLQAVGVIDGHEEGCFLYRYR